MIKIFDMRIRPDMMIGIAMWIAIIAIVTIVVKSVVKLVRNRNARKRESI